MKHINPIKFEFLCIWQLVFMINYNNIIIDKCTVKIDTNSANAIDIIMKMIYWSYFTNFLIVTDYNALPNFKDVFIQKIMKSLDWKIKNLTIFSSYAVNFKHETRENVYKYIISEYGTNIETYGVFKLLVNTNLINSLKRVSFINYSKVDFKSLHSLAEREGVSDLYSKIKFEINKPKSTIKNLYWINWER